MDILIFSVLTNVLYFCCGSIFVSDRKSDFHSQFYIYFVGVATIAFISLLLNFITPLNQAINSAVYCAIVLVFAFKTKFIFNKKQINFLLLSSFITFLLIIYSNVNRPDAGLYHLPYISLINENKIIVGASNIHSRFGHVSILQYLSAINNNYLFSANGISIPLASIVSFFYIYFFYDVWKVFKKKETPDLAKFFSLFILIYISFKITRYSSFGNDAVAHLCFFYLISCVLKEDLKKTDLKKILLISVFAFINKPMLGLIFIIPALIFFVKNNFELKKIFILIFSFPALLLYLWLVKNILVSGCAIFPMKITCLESLAWTNVQKISSASAEGNAWSKGWPDRIDTKISMEEFSKNLNWVQAWSKNHLKYILNIIIPFTGLLLFIVFYIKIRFKQVAINNDKNLRLRFLLLLTLSLIGTVSFFFLFPIYRYGYSYIITLISLVLLMTIKNKINIKENTKIFQTIFIFCFILVAAKQVQKIYKNSSNTIWPNIYTLESNGKVFDKTKIKIKKDFIYYLATQGDNLCMYSTSPCTTYKLDTNIEHKKKYTYSILSLK